MAFIKEFRFRPMNRLLLALEKKKKDWQVSLKK